MMIRLIILTSVMCCTISWATTTQPINQSCQALAGQYTDDNIDAHHNCGKKHNTPCPRQIEIINHQVHISGTDNRSTYEPGHNQALFWQLTAKIHSTKPCQLLIDFSQKKNAADFKGIKAMRPNLCLTAPLSGKKLGFYCGKTDQINGTWTKVD